MFTSAVFDIMADRTNLKYKRDRGAEEYPSGNTIVIMLK